MHILNIARHGVPSESVVSPSRSACPGCGGRYSPEIHAHFDACALEYDTNYDNSLDFSLGRAEASRGFDFLSCRHVLECERSRGNDFA
jgi:hypothetical protein